MELLSVVGRTVASTVIDETLSVAGRAVTLTVVDGASMIFDSSAAMIGDISAVGWGQG
jgi:hypothetical protein